jgi:hypothetical protein
MGMSKGSLELQVQMQTQKAIAELQQNMQHLDQTVRIIDGNMRQSHTILLADMTKYAHKQSLYINFILNEYRSKMNEEEIKDFEERFKIFAEGENEKMKAQHDELVKRQKEAEEKKKLEDDGEKLVEN